MQNVCVCFKCYLIAFKSSMLEQLRCFLVQKTYEAEILLKETSLEYTKIFHLLAADMTLTGVYKEENVMFHFIELANQSYLLHCCKLLQSFTLLCFKVCFVLLPGN